ncbi:adenylyl-sulfate kinase [Spirosoma flavus]
MLFVQFTGLSGSGKTTLAYRVQNRLIQLGYAVEVLDGDEYRRNLWPELTYSEADRAENIRRLGFIGRKFIRHNVLVLMAAINPIQRIRDELNRENQPAKTVFVSCALPTLIARDTKGLYARALLPASHSDKLTNLTGVNSPYEVPLLPDLTVPTDQLSEEECEELLVQFILNSLP